MREFPGTSDERRYRRLIFAALDGVRKDIVSTLKHEGHAIPKPSELTLWTCSVRNDAQERYVKRLIKSGKAVKLEAPACKFTREEKIRFVAVVSGDHGKKFTTKMRDLQDSQGVKR